MRVGSLVKIISGTHEGLEGKILALVSNDSRNLMRQQQAVMGDRDADEIDDEAYVSVELKLNQCIVNIRRKRLVLESQREVVYRKSRSRSPPKEETKEKRLKWVIPGLIVRVVSKKVEGGRLYNTKVKISDVLSAFKFHAIPHDGSSTTLYENLREKDIETVIPKEDGQQVSILKGEFKGEIGKILSRDKKKEQLTIQVGMTDIIHMHLDDCCAVYSEK